jgi:hypothetical protein
MVLVLCRSDRQGIWKACERSCSPRAAAPSAHGSDQSCCSSHLTSCARGRARPRRETLGGSLQTCAWAGTIVDGLQLLATNVATRDRGHLTSVSGERQTVLFIGRAKTFGPGGSRVINARTVGKDRE